jgi:ankyrin repeat protein
MRLKVLVAWSIVLLTGTALHGAERRDPIGRAGETAGHQLLQAVKAGDRTAALGLIRQRADVNTREPDGTAALHWAARQDDLELAEALIHGGARVMSANRYGVTPLYLASVNGSAPMIEALLKAGADANAAGPEGETALMTVARTGSVEAAKVLLAHGAAVDARESWLGQTALTWAAAERHPDMVRELIAAGADVNARSSIREWERQVTAEPREKWLPRGGLTPLLFAAREGCLDCARMLIDAGADKNATDPDGMSALVLAIINGHYDVGGVLIEKGTDPNLADYTGRTALYAAVDLNTMPSSNRPAPKVLHNRLTALDLIRMLLDRGANPNARLKRQQPYRTKLDRGADTMLGAGTTPFLRAAKAADVPAMRLLLERGADPRLANGSDIPVDVNAAPRRLPGGINPLMAAAGLGTREEDTTGRRKTEADAIEAIRICLEAGVDINAVDGRGQTALHGAALQGFDQVVKFLADNGARLDVKDSRGLTPLDMAMGQGGGFGFGGTVGVPRPTTAALLQQLIAAKTGR